MHRYEFISTIDDLLDAEEADTTDTSGMRRLLRRVVAVLLSLILVVFLSRIRSMRSWQQIVPILACSYGVYYFGFAGYFRTRWIRRENAESAEIIAEFGDDHMSFDVLGGYAYTREWTELLSYARAPKGVLLRFSDGTINWLPNRVLGSSEEERALVEFLRHQSEQHGAREDEEAGT